MTEESTTKTNAASSTTNTANKTDDVESSSTDSLTFREAMTELNSIVSALDSNELGLEDSLKKYERGVELVRTLKVRLNEAQQKVDVLMGELEPEPDDKTRDTTLS